MFGELFGSYATACFQQSNLQSCFGEPLCRPAAGGARPDYNCIIFLLQNVSCHECLGVSGRGMLASFINTVGEPTLPAKFLLTNF